MTGHDAEKHSTIDPELPYWIRQAAEFSGAVGRTARSRGPLAVIAWILIIATLGTLVAGWAIALFRT